MRVTFLRDHRGYETQERYFTVGQSADLPTTDARALIARGWARQAKDGDAVSEPAEVVPTISTATLVPLSDVAGAEAFEDALNEVEIRTAFDLAHASMTMLTRAKGVGEKRAEALQQAARELLYPEGEAEEEAEGEANGAD